MPLVVRVSEMKEPRLLLRASVCVLWAYVRVRPVGLRLPRASGGPTSSVSQCCLALGNHISWRTKRVY